VAAAEGRLSAHTPAPTVLADTSSPAVDVPAELAHVLEPPDVTASDTDVDAVLLAAQLPSEPNAAMPDPADVTAEELSPRGDDLASQVIAANATVEELLPNDEDFASQVIATVQSWRVAWEQGDLEAYMTYYAPRARQGSRKNAEAIKKQKEALWKRLKPASVLLEDMRVTVDADTARVVMRQTYTDENGSGDIGRKTLSLISKDGAWLITQEDWSALPNETGN
jgi:ketosteroid isomerase-like protein